MRKTILLTLILLFLTTVLFGQTWTVEGNEHFDFEFRLITQEQWLRIKTAHETTAAGVALQYADSSETSAANIISGTRPNIQDYYYVTTKVIPKGLLGDIATGFIIGTLLYGHPETGVVLLMFLNNMSIYANAINLRFDRERYIQQFNQLIALIEAN